MHHLLELEVNRRLGCPIALYHSFSVRFTFIGLKQLVAEYRVLWLPVLEKCTVLQQNSSESEDET